LQKVQSWIRQFMKKTLFKNLMTLSLTKRGGQSFLSFCIRSKNTVVAEQENSRSTLGAVQAHTRSRSRVGVGAQQVKSRRIAGTGAEQE
jgi:hypothetical protein